MTLTYIINILLFILPIFFTLYITFKDRVKSPAVFTVVIAILIYLVIDFVSALIYYRLGSDTLSRTLLSTAALLSGAAVFYLAVNYKLTQCIFIVSIIKCYADDTTLFTSFLYFIIRQELPSSLFNFPSWIFLIVTALTCPLIFLFFKKLVRPALDYTEHLPFWSFMCGIPLCNNVLYSLSISPSFTSSGKPPGTEFYLVPILWVLLSFSTYIVMLKMITEISRNARLEEKLHISEIQVSTQQKQVENFQQRIEQTSQVRHDMRHHITVLQGFVNQKDYNGLNNYLNEYSSILDLDAPAIYCENTTLNIVLGHYKNNAKEKDIPFTLSLSLEPELPVTDTDLCILLGNLFENALEACTRQQSPNRFINATFSMPSKSVLVIIIENSYDGKIKRPGGTFLSSKSKGRKGMGIPSVLTICEKYNGIPKFEYGNQIFKVSLLLNKKRCP